MNIFEEILYPALQYITEYNLITLMFYFYSFVVSILGFFIFFDSWLPHFIVDAFNYGKLANRKINSIINLFQVPKRWFVHFYILAVGAAVSSIILFWSVNVKGNLLPSSFKYLLDICTTTERYPAVNGQLSCLILFIYSAHTLKRLLENCFITIFGNSKMSFLHYIVGLTHYLGAFIGLVSQFPGFNSKKGPAKIDFLDLSWWELTLSAVVILASFFQFKSLSILAKLRRCPGNKKPGKSEENKYFIPRGGFFKYVSCPHMFMEIVIYVGIASMMQFNHSTWNVVCLFVCCNQINMGLLNHKWYRNHFKDYPLDRKAILPFVL